MSEEDNNNKADQSQSETEKVIPSVARIVLSESEKDSLTKEQWAQKWLTMESYVDQLEQRVSTMEADITNLKASEERSKQQNAEALQRERILIRRITNKDQEIQDYVNQIAELKAGQAPGASALRSSLLDPAVNLLLHRLRQEVSTLKTRLEETQNELSAWKFTPDSNTGKRLMAKCRLLYQENEELGRVVSSGRLAKLEGDLALQKSFSEEVKKSQSELDEYLQDLDEDVEGMQSTIYILQQELRKTKEELAELQQSTTTTTTASAENAETVLKGDESNNRTGSAEFWTGSSQNDRLTNGNHSVLYSSRTTNQSNKVIESEKSDSEKKRTCQKDGTSDSCKLSKLEDGNNCDSETDNEVNGVRKRTFDERNSDSDNVPSIKKTRRSSELSLDYNEDELCLVNGETKPEDH
ncbi:UNVERIFIED_CONTAM: hypothetical protein PYX00_003115 [Menopon gallinae]|uniref:Pre-mRNA-splicing regulator female-lethal(2)D n=1 Tax=Menopon gallinae TaxID=328185 RepID=A0AAW2HZY1_9NEOP